jgi:peroxiredoxin
MERLELKHWQRRLVLLRLLVLLVPLCLALSGSVSAVDNHWLNTPVAAIQGADDDYDSELQKATDLLRRRKYEDALKSFKRANDLRGKKSAEALFGMAQAYFGLQAFKNVAETSDKLIAVAGDDKTMLLQAYNLKGIAFQALAEGKNEKKLQEAEGVLRQGIALDPAGTVPTLHYNLGYVLMQLNRDAEGISEIKKYLELYPEAPDAERATKIIENPRRTREAFAPDFSITTSEGEHITLEDLRGKVVVLDFWGTWCGPCVESIPALRSLNKKFSKEPSFVLIGVSSDTEEEVWRAFTTKEKMIWPQFWDRERRVQRAFNVRAFPTYIVIDHEGIIRFRSSGTSWERSAYLSDAIKKHLKVVAKTDAVNQ